jgi:poly(hydroxyalkanoate) depolymerase family esterase
MSTLRRSALLKTRGLHRAALLALLAALLSSCMLGTDPRIDVTTRVNDFGTNPAHLRMFEYLPADLPANPPLVVVLHHCFQVAADYVQEAGWQKLADRYKFVILMPEEVPFNDLNRCWRWWSDDALRGKGEPESIRQMIEKSIAMHDIDRKRVYITGLSSGGSMTLVMMATYPELFAGGGSVGAVPFRCADTMIDVPDCMAIGGFHSPQGWGDLVREAGPKDYAGPWPTLSYWHGDGDVISTAGNGDAIVEQWTNVHGADAQHELQDKIDGYPHYVYEDGQGQPVVEFFRIVGMGHSVPVDPKRGCGDDRDGVGDWVTDRNICSSFWMAKFWGLTGGDDEATAEAGMMAAPTPTASQPEPAPTAAQPAAQAPAPATDQPAAVPDQPAPAAADQPAAAAAADQPAGVPAAAE